MENLWAWVATALGAIVLIGNAAEKIGKAWKAAKAPGDELRAEVDELKEWRKGVDQKLSADKRELASLREGFQPIFKSLLALLDHGIDGNNVAQMESAKEEVRNHLIHH